jgi:hypothetical protein
MKMSCVQGDQAFYWGESFLEVWILVLVRKCEGKRPFGKHTSRWESSVKMDSTQTFCEDID